ncbi:glycosyltransferase [Flavobacteriaceae bacterium XHP0103]|uniref:glycosyltransferase n=1 Tax=Marixanthotalea marina TaxID=2844359 RepID=UPI002989A44C|nr:glycosyltransferase [Marixanthotalea marina]MBU3820661.1 glycosyltransferase [Marixanthotalea marina]
MNKIIVISAINFTSGGPLSILKDCLNELSINYANEFKVIALVNKKSLLKINNIEFIEFPLSKKSWFFRLFYEYIYFWFFSIKVKPNYWLSLHDITPNVRCHKQFVYCHNPAPFNKVKIKDFFLSPKVYLFTNFYKFLYKINIRKNNYVIVQQDWIRKAFNKAWNLNNILVAYPDINTKTNCNLRTYINSSKKNNINFFYPSFPRPFKNFEIICEAYASMPDYYRKRSKVYLTINKNLNKYSKKIVENFENTKGINFVGILNRSEVFDYYNNSDCLIFPSKLETWGLPITEFKPTKKPILLAKEPYAIETLGNYEKVAFFNSNNSEKLKKLMMSFIDGSIVYQGNSAVKVEEPFTEGWQMLFDKILQA